MSQITINNYEAFLLDHLEGNLSPELQAELLLFFETHPELREDLDEFELFTIVPESSSFDQKETLKVDENHIGIINYEEAMIAEIEGENSPETSAELATFLQAHAKKGQELETYRKTRLLAPEIIFNDKDSLKQKEDRVIPLYWWYSAAAAVILALFLLKGINWNEEQGELPIAEEKTELIQPEEELVIPESDHRLAIETNHSEEAEEKEAINTPKQQTPKKQIKANNVQVTPETLNSDNNLIAEKPASENDTTVIQKVNTDDPVIDELVADQVKIIYEDETEDQSTDTILPSNPKKVSRLRLLGEVFASKVKDKVLDEKTNTDGDVVAYALNVGPFNFTRNRREK